MSKVSKVSKLAAVASAALMFVLATPAHAGVITDITPCGGKGKILQMRLSGASGSGPHHIVANSDATVEVDFRPAKSHATSRFRLVFETPVGDLPVTDGDFGAITAGKAHTASYKFRPSNLLVGQTVNMRATVTGGSTVEVCAKVAVRVVAAP